jgi:hypothetical protein
MQESTSTYTDKEYGLWSNSSFALLEQFHLSFGIASYRLLFLGQWHRQGSQPDLTRQCKVENIHMHEGFREYEGPKIRHNHQRTSFFKNKAGNVRPRQLERNK